MNGYERVLATLNRQPVDRPAWMPITMMFAADQIGTPYGRYAADWHLLVRAQLETARRFGFDYVSAISDPAREAADLGAVVHYYDDQPPALSETEALLRDKERLGTLRPADPLKPGGRMLDRVEAIRAFVREVKHERWIEGWVEGPCAEGADLRGINTLMLDFMDDPAFVHRLFDFCVNNALGFAAAQIEAGADIIGIGDAAASLVGPRVYYEFVLPYEKRLIDGIHARGGRVRLHICGNITRSLREIATLGCDFVDIDSMVSLEKARAEMGPEQVLAGNIDPVKTLRAGTPESIRAAMETCRRTAGERYILSAGCEVPRDTPEENLRAMRLDP